MKINKKIIFATGALYLSLASINFWQSVQFAKKVSAPYSQSSGVKSIEQTIETVTLERHANIVIKTGKKQGIVPTACKDSYYQVNHNELVVSSCVPLNHTSQLDDGIDDLTVLYTTGLLNVNTKSNASIILYDLNQDSLNLNLRGKKVRLLLVNCKLGVVNINTDDMYPPTIETIDSDIDKVHNIGRGIISFHHLKGNVYSRVKAGETGEL